ncbi:3-deoxy-manno-octulosonate-8-phosphatase KdsC [Aestuariibacter sp. A3R04]|uniref:3-deoxy-manno-octulosonate-8-phosphatase KdsC n=1 Tax=Aestuariibacter sp. A3R04 TaxID=2841571 RepID=UPI001C09D37D|nr:3-deoxy-manno-octulosonate-8-phosphatase KdsC [Aestuariibacter sp. A3R04]MBU3020936.1 3-deoxy-manno-octulosonate-8-phosphatase KdsC [Aestuariibacter sp. A3R04]
MGHEVTFYGVISEERFEKLKSLKLLVCDVDGVFSDGRIYLGNDGEELKAFHTRDGYGVKALINSGVDVAIITGRDSAIVKNRMTSLSVSHIIQGQENKAEAIAGLCNSLGLASSQVAAIGDDMPDLGMYAYADTKIAVKDAHPAVTREANWITTQRGGFGAVREVCDVIMQALGTLETIHGASI